MSKQAENRKKNENRKKGNGNDDLKTPRFFCRDIEPTHTTKECDITRYCVFNCPSRYVNRKETQNLKRILEEEKPVSTNPHKDQIPASNPETQVKIFTKIFLETCILELWCLTHLNFSSNAMTARTRTSSSFF